VVTTGELFLIDTSKAELHAESVQHVSMLRHIKSDQINGIFNVDFVTQKGMEEFVQTKVNPFAEKIVELANNRPELFRKHTR
jgi:hypothetical protein